MRIPFTNQTGKFFFLIILNTEKYKNLRSIDTGFPGGPVVKECSSQWRGMGSSLVGELKSTYLVSINKIK